MLIILTFFKLLFIIEQRDYNENDINGMIRNERKEGLFMKDFLRDARWSFLQMRSRQREFVSGI